MTNPCSNPLFYSDCVDTYFRNFFKQSGIKTFGFIEVYADGSYIQLESNRDIHSTIIDSSLHSHMPLHILNSTEHLGFSLSISNQSSQGPTTIIDYLKQEYKLGNSLAFIDFYSTNDGLPKLNHFYVTTDEHRHCINNYYINNLALIKKVFVEFTVRFKRELLKIQKTKINQNQMIPFKDLFEEKLKLKKRISDGSPLSESAFDYTSLPFNLKANLLLTEKEKEIIYLYFHRFSNEMIATKLEISRRTLDRHFENMRKKFNCQTTGHIIPALMA